MNEWASRSGFANSCPFGIASADLRYLSFTVNYTPTRAPGARRCRRADVSRDAESLRVPDAHRQRPFILARPDPDPPRPARGPAPARPRPRPSGRGPPPCPSRPTGPCHPAEGAAGAGARLTPAVGSAARESIRASPRPPRRAEAPARPASPPRGRAGPAGPHRGKRVIRGRGKLSGPPSRGPLPSK